MPTERAVEMFVGGLVLDPNTQAPVVILKNESGEFCLPIWIGAAEATSIASVIKQVGMARPLTHDLMHNIFLEVGIKVERVMITELRDSTYFAELVLSLGEKALIMDSRPSDAIAIALRESAPIYVAQTVLDQAKITFTPASETEGGEPEVQPPAQEGGDDPKQGKGDFSQISKEKWAEILKDLDPDDFKYEM
jgi:uncharacterized protein